MKKYLIFLLASIFFFISANVYAGLTSPTGGNGLTIPSIFCKTTSTNWSFCNSSDTLTIGSILINGTSAGPLTVTNTSTSAFLAEKADGTDIFTLDTQTPRLTMSIGDMYIATTTKGLILMSPDGTCDRISVNNSDVLSATSVTCP